MRKTSAKILAVLALLCVGFTVAMPSSATWLGQLVTSKANSAPKVVSFSSSSGGVSVRFSEKVRAVHRSFGLECPMRRPHGFTLTASPAQTFTLGTAKQKLRVGSTCKLVVRAAWIHDLAHPSLAMKETFTATFKVQAPLTPPKVTTTGKTTTATPTVVTPTTTVTTPTTTTSTTTTTTTTGGGGGGGGGGGSTNHAPTDITLTGSATRPENQAIGTTVGALAAVDADTGQTSIFTLVSAAGCSGTDDAFFSIAGNTLQIAQTLDFELKPTYTICVRATDNGTPALTFDKQFTITVTDVQEAPKDITLTPSSVAENQAVGTTVGTLAAVDQDAGSSTTLAFASSAGCPGTDNAKFAITTGNQLKTAATFDFEAKSSYAICVRATDNTSLTLDKTLTVTVTNVNEAPTNVSLTSATIAENMSVGSEVGTLSVTDPDTGDTALFALACAGADNNAFAISNNKLTTASVLDFEAKSSYSVCVRITDGGGLTFDKTFTITVTDANDAPSDIQLAGSTVAENQSVGTSVGTLSSTDQDVPAQSFTYSLVAGTGSGDNGSFSIAGSALKTAVSFDFEAVHGPTYSVRVRVTDSGAPQLFFEKVFTVTVTNVNEAPTDVTLTPATVAENQASGTTVGTLAAVDPDAGDSASFVLACGGTDNGSFTISGSTLKTAASFDFEAKSSYSICVRATDGGALTFDKTLTVTVTNVNEAPTNIALVGSSVAENQPSGTTVGALSATDPDTGDSATFALTCPGVDNGSFTISGTTLKTAASFDFEARSSYSVCVRITDGGGLTFDKTFTITVTDANDAPSDIQLAGSTVAENQSVGTSVGTLSSTDQDVPAQSFTYSLVAGTGSGDNGSFSIAGSALKTAVSFDFEAVHGPTYSVRVRVTDSGAPQLFFEKVFTVTVTNVNEAPTDVTLTPATVAENQASGTTVGTLAAVDPDAGDSASFVLACGGTDNGSFTISGSTLKTAASFDFEAKSSYSICVRATDGGALTFDKTLTVTVTNVNEAPTNIALVGSSVAENQPSGTTVGALSATDPDTGDSATFALTCPGVDNGSFTISGTTLKTAASFDFEARSSYSVCVRITDGGGLTFDKTFTITVTDANDAPSDIQLAGSTVAENQSVGTSVGTLSSTDQDVPAQSFTYSLVAGTGSGDNGSFSIAGSALKTAVSFDFEAVHGPTYSVRVRVTDSGTPQLFFEKVFTVTVTNVNEAPTDITLAPSGVAEHQPSGTTVGTLAAIDPDAGDTAAFALVTSGGCPGTDNASFTISGSSLKTAATFDLATKSSYTICVRATDGGTLTVDKPLTVTVTKQNVAPTDIALSSSTIAENQPSGTTVGTLSATDPNSGDTAAFTLGCPGADNGSFTISGTTLKTAASFDFETKPSYSICVRVTDSGSLTFDKTFVVTVTDANDAPTNIALSSSSVAENVPSGTAVGTLSSTDQDLPAQSFTYTLVAGTGSADNGSFSIAGSTLKTAASFDFETRASYSIRVRTTDNGAPTQSFEKVFAVTVIDVNDAPTNVTLTPASIAENQPSGTTIGTLAAADQDAGASAIFTLVSSGGCPGTDNASFTVGGSALKTAASFDFETKSSYTICVRATDNGALTFDKPLTVTVTDVNEAPTNIALSASTVAENQPSGTTVGTLSATDPDAGDSATFTLGCPGADNSSFTISGTTLKTAASFDFETKPSYSICVRATDSGSLTFDKTFTVVVTNVNETPTDIALSNASVPEDQPAITTVGTLSPTDPDQAQSFTFSLVSGTGSADNSSFTISGNQLQTAGSFDFETKSSYSIRVRVTDNGTPQLSFEKVFTITVLDVNESPTNISLAPSSLAENQPAGTTVGTLAATDPDAGSAATFTLATSGGCAGTDNGSFTISGNQLKSAASFDFETKSSYAICVRATDNGTPGLTFDKVLTVTVTDVNEPPVAVNDTLAPVAEDSAQRTIAPATLLANDSAPTAETGQTLTVTGVSNPIGGTVLFNGTNVLFTPAADFNGPASFDYTITDNGQTNGSPDPKTTGAHVTFTITEINDPPVALDDSLTAIDEDSGQRTITKASLLANDSKGPANESAQTLDITAVSNAVGGTVSISGANVLFTPNANYNGPASFDYTVSDNGTTSGAADSRTDLGSVSFTINAVNDAPVISGPASAGTTLDTDKVLAGYSVSDVDSGSDSVQLSLAAAHGKLTLSTTVASGLTAGDVTGNGTSSVTVTASTAKIDATLGDAAGLTYHSSASFSGSSDTVNLSVDDLGHNGSGGNKTGARTVTVAFDLSPTANAQSVSTNEDTAKTVTLTGSDPESDPLSFVITSLPASGQLHEGSSAAGTLITSVPHALPGTQVTYVPAANANGNGIGSFSFKANDGFSDSAAATVTLYVTPVDDLPAAVNDSPTVLQDSGANTIDVLANDTDIDGGPKTVQQVTQGANGVVAITNAGANLTYAPAAGTCGNDSFTYTLNGGSIGTVNVTVTCSNTPPVGHDDSGTGFATDEDTSFITGNVLANDADNEGNALSVASLNLTGTHGTVTNNHDGTFTYDPGAFYQSLAAGQSAQDVFHYAASDGHGGTSASTAVTINITGLNDDPKAVTDNTTTNQNTFVTIGVLANDTDVDSGATISLSGVDVPDNGGSANIVGSQIEFHPGSDFRDLNVGDQRVTQFTYEITDGVGGFATGTVKVTVTGLNDAPVAHVDVFTSSDDSAVSGLTLAVGTNPAEPHIGATGDVLTNDTDVDTDHANLTATAPTTTDNGGSFSMNPDGTFDYTPAAGFLGDDSITYTVHDNGPGGGLTSTAQILLEVIGPRVWFVKPGAATCTGLAICGTAKAPFPSLDSLSGASDPDGSNDVIFVYHGSATTNGFVLEQGQTLVGEPQSLSVTDDNGVDHNNLVAAAPANQNPTISNTAGPGLTLAPNSQVEAVTVTGSSGSGIMATSVNQATVASNVTVSGNGGAELDLTGGTTGVIDFGGTILNGSAGRAVSITGRHSGIVAVSGPITDTSGTGTGISLTGNSGSPTINFTGGMQLATGANDAFTATGGGNVSVDDTLVVNTLATSSGVALKVQNANIASPGLRFQSISAGTGAGSAGDGIVLDTTGSAAGLTVTGTGTAGGGGTIQHKTGADGASTSGIGILLKDTSNVSLSSMQLNDFDNFAIRANNVTSFSLDSSVVSGDNGTSNSVADTLASGVSSGEDAIRLTNVFGTDSITNSTISGGYMNTILAENTSGNASLTIDACTIGGRTDNGTGMKDGVHVQADNAGTIMSAIVTNSALTTARSDVIEMTGALDSTLNVEVDGNTITNNHPSTESAGGTGVNVSGLGDVQYEISQNTFNLSAANGGAGINSSAIIVGELAGSTGDYDGTISANTIGASGVAHSGGGTSTAPALSVLGQGSGTSHTMAVLNNILYHYGAVGMSVQNINGSNSMNATILGNKTSQSDAASAQGLTVQLGVASSADTGNLNILIGGAGADANDFSLGNPVASGNDVVLTRNPAGGTVFNLSLGVSSAVNAAQVVKDNNLNPLTTLVTKSGNIVLVSSDPLLP